MSTKNIDKDLVKSLLKSIKPPEVDAQTTIKKLATMTEMEYAAERKQRAKSLDLPLATLDSLVQKQRRKLIVERCGEFVLTDQGLFACDEYNQPQEQLTSPFTIISECRSEQGMEHHLVIAVTSAQSMVTKVMISRRSLAGDGKEAVQILLDAGMRFTSADGAQRKLLRYMVSVEVDQVHRLVVKPGWHDTVYVTASGETLPETETNYVYNAGHARGVDMDTLGTLEEWRCEVSSLATGNHYVILFTSLALASLILPLLKTGSFIINLVGTSSTGKSTVLKVANSTMGSPVRLKTWRITSNALEGLAEAFNHSFLALDEMGQVSAKEVGEIAYLLSQDQGKGRATKDGNIRFIKSWNLTGGSTGEVTLAEQMRSIGNDSKVGQEVRIIDIEIDPDTPYGVFHQLNGATNGEELSNRFQSLSQSYYGTPARAFIHRIQELGFEAVMAQTQELMQQFRATFLPAAAGGQVCRVAERFALLAATGELATRWGITGWGTDHAFQSIGIVFNQWLESRGTVGAQEERKILSKFKYFFELNGDSRFVLLGTNDTYARTVNQRAGYRCETDGKVDYYVFAETFKTELCAGFSRKLVVEVLTNAGILLPMGKSPSRVIRTGAGSVRVYHLQNVINHDANPEEDAPFFQW